MDVAELRNEEHYTLLLQLNHDEILPFVQEEFSHRTGVLRFYFGLNGAILLYMVGLAIWQVAQGMTGIGTILQYTGLGFVVSLTLLIPVHEGIHGLAYKLVGAPRIAFGGSLKRFYFYAVADRFVLGPDQFRFVALAPFVVINALAFAATFYVSLNYQWLCWGVLLMHTGACAGDFGMLSFYARQEDREVYTYDIVEEKVTYFYSRRKSGKGETA